MKSGTYYQATKREPAAHTAYRGKANTRVAIIGGGYAGLATALGLAERGIHDVRVLEAESIGFGASGRNGGFVFGGYSLGEAALRRQAGAETANWMYQLTRRAVATIRQRITRYAIQCDPVDAGVIWANWFRDSTLLSERQQLLRQHFDVDWTSISAAELRPLLRTDRYCGGLFEPEAFHVHPLNLALGLARAAQGLGVQVHGASPVTRIDAAGKRWRVYCGDACLEADTVVIAGGGYLPAGLMPQLHRALLPIATYVAVTEPLGDRLNAAVTTHAAVYDTRFAFDYYRALPDSRLLWGGRISIMNRSPESVARLLRRDITRVYPQLGQVSIDYAWSGLMSYARHEMPQLGLLQPGLWYGQAFGGHGVATTTAIGEILAAAIAEDDSSWARFQPFGLERTWRPLGFIGAQATYSWLQARDAWKDRQERRR